MAALIIVGPGAVGVGLGAELLRHGHSVRFIGRAGPVDVKARVRIASGHSTALQVIDIDAKEAAADGVSDAAIFCVKAIDLESALKRAEKTLPVSLPFVILCNGAIEGLLSQILPVQQDGPFRIYRIGIGTVGVSATSERSSAQGGPDETMEEYSVRSSAGVWAWGAFSPSNISPMPWETEVFKLDRFEWTAQPLQMVRKKWLVNTVLNSLAGAHRLLCNGDIISRIDELSAVLAEALDLGRELWGSWDKSDAELRDLVLKIARDTSENENSMARDVRLGRETESRWLAGIATGRHGYPLLKALHERLD